MGQWRKDAVEEITDLKPYWVDKHGWQPAHVVTDDAIDLFVRLVSRRLDGHEFVLRLRYLPDWQTAPKRVSSSGRRTTLSAACSRSTSPRASA